MSCARVAPVDVDSEQCQCAQMGTQAREFGDSHLGRCGSVGLTLPEPPSPTKPNRVPAEPRGRVEVLLRIVGDVDTLGSGSVLTLELLESFGMWLPVRAVRPELIGDHHPREPPVQAKRLDLVSLGCGIPVGEESQLD